MATQLLLVLVTAVVTAAATIAAAWFLYQRYVKQMLIDWIDGKAQEIGQQMKDNVREGVQDGIKDGVAEVGAHVVRKTRESATRGGIEMLEDSVNFWFGGLRKRPKGDDDEG